MIDPLYTDVEQGVNLVVYSRRWNDKLGAFMLPTYQDIIFSKFTSEEGIVITEDVFETLVMQNLLNEIVTYAEIDGITYESYA